MNERWEYRIVQPAQKGMSGEAIRKNSEAFLNNFGLQGLSLIHI